MDVYAWLLALWLAAGGDERRERKDILKTMVSGTANNVQWGAWVIIVVRSRPGGEMSGWEFIKERISIDNEGRQKIPSL